jgi:uncharacterized membrane protein YhiD involved in acid resistance
MKTILLDTALIIGITFAVGFIVAALIKLVTFLLTFAQENSLKDMLKMWRRDAKLHEIKRLRIEIIAKKEENTYEVFSYSLSHNLKDRKKRSSGFVDYPVSYNKD